VAALLTSVDAQGHFFSHDKLEGMIALNAGATLVISNDSDFGIDGVTNSAPPFQLHTKTSPTTGQQDDGEFLVIDAIRSTATVTISIVDTIAPQTTLVSMPSNPSRSGTAVFTFQGADSGAGVAGFECALDGPSFSSCASGIGYSGLTDGSHTFMVRAIDGAGNKDATPAGYTWTVDQTPPTIRGMPVSGCSIWPPNHKLVQIAAVTATDAGTGLAGGSLLVSVTSNEPLEPGDVQITNGVVQVRADRLGTGNGRVYTVAARAMDVAGNTANATGTCIVPHDQGSSDHRLQFSARAGGISLMYCPQCVDSAVSELERISWIVSRY
jgi:hypothetical protein